MPHTIVFPATDDMWDSEKECFVSMKEQSLVIEHSLISLSKWERIWKKPFLSTEDKTMEQWISYIECMTLNPVNKSVYTRIDLRVMNEILKYIEDPMTATTFSNLKEHEGKREIITSEIIYYYLFKFGIPKEVEKWHLNTLMTLIHVFSIKDGEQQKMSKEEAAMYQRQVNESRRKSRPRR